MFCINCNARSIKVCQKKKKKKEKEENFKCKRTMEKGRISLVNTTQPLYVICCFSDRAFTYENRLQLITTR